MLRLGVPSHRFLGDSVSLRCLFDLEGERLYSVKWYKDREEFFRFIPADRKKPITVFRLPGVRVWVRFERGLKKGKIDYLLMPIWIH